MNTRNKAIKGIATISIALLLIFMTQAVSSANQPAIVIGDTNVVGKTAKVPVVIQNVSNLQQGVITISLPHEGAPFSFKNVELASRFDDQDFYTSTPVEEGQLKIDFTAPDAQTLNNEKIGYIVFERSDSSTKGSEVTISVTDQQLFNHLGNRITVRTYSGEIAHNHQVGDVLGYDEPTPASAAAILQHVSGMNPIIDQELLKIADVDGDGSITNADARNVLEAAIGVRQSLLTIAPPGLEALLRNQPITYQLDAKNGKAPYHWTVSRGRLPRGLSMDQDNGTISGTPTRTENSTFTVRVEDRFGVASEREMTLSVTDSDIVQYEPVSNVYAIQGSEIPLQPQIHVEYKDGSTGFLPLVWNSHNIEHPGTYSLTGEIGDTKIQVQTIVHLFEREFFTIERVTSLDMLSIHTIEIEASSQVYTAKVDDIPMHYEGKNQFSLVTTTLNENSTIYVYDRFGQLLEAKKINGTNK